MKSPTEYQMRRNPKGRTGTRPSGRKLPNHADGQRKRPAQSNLDSLTALISKGRVGLFKLGLTAVPYGNPSEVKH